MDPCAGFGRMPWDVYGVGQGEGFDWTWDTTVRLSEYVDPSAVFPLQALYAYPVHTVE